MRASLKCCGFGGVGPLRPPGVPNAWVVALVEITAEGAELSAVRIASVSLIGADNAVIASATPLIDTRVAPSTRTHFDYSDAGTTPFDGAVTTTTVLRVHAALDARAEVVYPAAARGPTRVRIEILDDTPKPCVVEGPSSPWSMA